MTFETVRVASLHRYPVKGLSPEPLDQAHLEADQHFPGDRLFAVENGPSGFDAEQPEHLPKVKFLMLMRDERLARLKTRYDEAAGVLEIRQGGHIAASGKLATQEGRRAIESFIASWLGDSLRGPPRLLVAPASHRFVDSRAGFVSLLNLASVVEIAKAAGRDQLDPLRFRANIALEGLPPFAEFEFVGKVLKFGEARLEVTKRTDRCAATDVDPTSGIRDLQIVPLMERAFGHHDCGVYARVIESGRIRRGDTVDFG